MVPPWVELRSRCYRHGGLYEKFVLFHDKKTFLHRNEIHNSTSASQRLVLVARSVSPICGLFALMAPPVALAPFLSRSARFET